MTAVGECSQCGGDVSRDMEGNLVCERCGSRKTTLPTIDMPRPPRPITGLPEHGTHGDWTKVV